MNLRSVRKPDCRYQLILEWSVEYNIDFLESLHLFRTIVTSESTYLTVIRENNVYAHNTVCYITSSCICNYISHFRATLLGQIIQHLITFYISVVFHSR